MNLDPLGITDHFSTTWLFLTLIPSAVGLVMFMYGRKQGRTPHTVAGLLYMIYPIVTPTVTSLLVGGVLITAGFWYALRSDW